MSDLVFVVVLISALVHASWNAILKGRAGAKRDPLPLSIGMSVTWAVVGVPILLVIGPPHPDAWIPIGVSVVIHVVYFGLLVAAYRRADLSFVYPIARGLPPVAVALLSGWVLGEQPSGTAFLGVVLVGLGVITIGLSGAGSLRQFGWAASVAAGTTAYTLVDAGGARTAGALHYIVWQSCLQGVLFASLALATTTSEVRRESARQWKKGAAIGVLAASGYGVVLWAMSQGLVASVAALRETSVLFAALIGTWLLGERFGRRRVLAAAVITVGVVLVRV